jgi:hypothetical protein
MDWILASGLGESGCLLDSPDSRAVLASLSIFDSFYQTTEETTENRS